MVVKLMQFGYQVKMISEEQTIKPPDDIEPWEYLQSMIYVIIVLAVIIVLIVALIKVLAAKNRGMQANRSVRTLSGIHFGHNKSLQIVEIGHHIYVIGVGDNVELIHIIEEEEEIDFIKQSLHTNDGLLSSGKFISMSQWLKRLRGSKATDEATVQADETQNFQDVFHHKMKRIKAQKNEMEKLLHMQNDREQIKDE